MEDDGLVDAVRAIGGSPPDGLAYHLGKTKHGIGIVAFFGFRRLLSGAQGCEKVIELHAVLPCPFEKFPIVLLGRRLGIHSDAGVVPAHADVDAFLVDGFGVVKPNRVDVVSGAFRPADEDDLLARRDGGLSELVLIEDGGIDAAVDGAGRTSLGVPIEGAIFRVWNDAGEFDETLTTDAGGIIVLKYLKHGSYHMQEVAAADGYVIDDVDGEGKARIHDFEVNDQGMVAMGDEPMQAKLAIVVENMPKTMGTTATDGDSGTHEGQARSDMSIIDSVAYTGCIPGETYKVTGKLMDKSTDQPALDAEGNEITAEKEFAAEDFEGSVDIEFRFDGSGLAGASLVAFESMLDAEGNIYMSHEDIGDEGQTVNVVDIATKAHDAETGTNQGTVSEAATLVDEVSFEGLTPGNRYKLFTMLVDKATGEPVGDVAGNPMVIETDFAPEAPDGTVDVVFELDTAELAGKSLVFFEKLADDGDNVIAKHEDIGDEGQTIELPEPDAPQNPVGKGYPKTGADAAKATVAASAAVIVGCGAAGAAYAAAKRRKKAGEEVEEPTAEPVE